MKLKALSIRTFIGAKDFQESRAFYIQLGFVEKVLDPKISYFMIDEGLGFYLQDYYVKDWVDNSMVFLEVVDLDKWHTTLLKMNLTSKFTKVRLSKVKKEDWGREVFLHDPSGVLWHCGEFKRPHDHITSIDG